MAAGRRGCRRRARARRVRAGRHTRRACGRARHGSWVEGCGDAPGGGRRRRCRPRSRMLWRRSRRRLDVRAACTTTTLPRDARLIRPEAYKMLKPGATVRTECRECAPAAGLGGHPLSRRSAMRPAAACSKATLRPTSVDAMHGGRMDLVDVVGGVSDGAAWTSDRATWSRLDHERSVRSAHAQGDSTATVHARRTVP